MLSHYLTYLLKKLQFLKIVIARFFIILFRRRKKIEELYINYDAQHLFENGLIVIKYRFRNAIYYRFGNHTTLEKQIKIFDLKNFDHEFDFVVYGLFQKRKYKLKFEPQLTLNADNFKTKFSNLSLKRIEQSIPKLSHPPIYCNIDKPIIKTAKIKIQNKEITISHKTFNQTDFI